MSDKPTPTKRRTRRATKSYPGSITRRSPGVWRVRLCVGGEYHSITVHGTKVDAQNQATAKYAELTASHERAGEGLPVDVKFADALKDFVDVVVSTFTPGAKRSYERSFVVFRTYFVETLENPLVTKIRRAHIKRFLAWRRGYRVGDETGEGKVSPHTVRRDLRVLHHLFNHAVDSDFCDANPCARVKGPKADDRDVPILDDAQLVALLKAAASNPMLSFYILLLAETGIRSDSEALQLRWEDFDLAAGFVHVKSAPGRRTKSGRSRSVPMTAALKTAFKEHAARFRMVTYQGARSAFVFHHVVHRRTAVAGAQIRSISGTFRRACVTAKMPKGFRRHDLRHRRVTSWLADGKSPVHVQQAVGHADIATTMGYYTAIPEHLRALVDDPAPTSEATSA